MDTPAGISIKIRVNVAVHFGLDNSFSKYVQLLPLLSYSQRC